MTRFSIFSILSAGLLTAAAIPAMAQPFDYSIAVPEADILAATGASGAELDSVAVTDDASTIYTFDSDGGTDGIIQYDVGTSTATVYVTEAQIEAAGGGSGASCDDLAMDSSGTLYALLRVNGGDNFVARIPSAGTVEVMISTANGQGGDAIAIDEANNRLILGYTNFFTSSVEQDLVHVPLTANDATPTVLISEADLSTALGGTAPGIADIAVQSDGTVLFLNAFGEGNADGDILQITPAGVASAFADNDDLVAASGTTTGTINTSVLDVLSDDRVVLIHGAADDFIVVGEADGSSWSFVADEPALESDPDLPAGYELDLQGNALAVDGADDIYWAGQTPPNAVIKATGFSQTQQLNAASWEHYE